VSPPGRISAFMPALSGRRILRPSWKDRYPLTPIAAYAAWRRADGLPFDPWMRVHARLGATVLRPEPQSMQINAPVADWEA